MYIFFNPNNRNKAAGDCVIRAICAAEGKDWDTVYDELCFEGKYGGDWGSNNDIWDNYLRKNGYKRGLVPTACPTCYTIEDFAEVIFFGYVFYRRYAVFHQYFHCYHLFLIVYIIARIVYLVNYTGRVHYVRILFTHFVYFFLLYVLTITHIEYIIST